MDDIVNQFATHMYIGKIVCISRDDIKNPFYHDL